MTNVSKAEPSRHAGKLSYVPQLDGLRAVAIGLVLVYHWLRPDFFVNLGYLGVSLFFVLSGFLIHRYFWIAGRKHRTASLVADRAFSTSEGFCELFHDAVLIVAWLAGFQIVRETWPWHAVYASNVLMAFYPGDLGVLAHFWSLSIEEQFYLLWPWIVVLLPINWLKGALAAFILIGPFFRYAAFNSVSNCVLGGLPFGSFDLLAAGGLLRTGNASGSQIPLKVSQSWDWRPLLPLVFLSPFPGDRPPAKWNQRLAEFVLDRFFDMGRN